MPLYTAEGYTNKIYKDKSQNRGLFEFTLLFSFILIVISAKLENYVSVIISSILFSLCILYGIK
jgi:hypothetical protein